MEFSLALGTELSAEEAQQLHEKLWAVFCKMAKEFTNGESASVSEENAQRLLSSLCFVLREYLEDTEKTERSLLSEDIFAAFEHGKKSVLKRVDFARELWNKACLTLPRVPSRALSDTLQGIKYGFSHYNIDLFAAEIPGSIDYQLMCPVPEETLGIEYTVCWLRRLLAENYILSRFEPRALRSVLIRVCPFYQELVINLCENPLQNAIGLVLLKKDPMPLSVTRSDRALLTEMFSPLKREQSEELLNSAGEELCRILLVPEEYCGTVCAFAKSLAPRIAAALPSKLCGIFV